ncbi:MAG: hypothetical protein KY440_08970, partial [Actinobacteria bacterium]|nr:hypothetical protein [Actinomycetota bacterium]
WFGLEALHLSHRSALLRKDPDWYGPLFASLGEPDLPADLPYLWPPAAFPRWPVRGGLGARAVPDALRMLGFDAARRGQAEVARAAADGRDVLLVARPGTGGSAAGLLAGLVTAGRTLWVSPMLGPRAAAVPPVPLPKPRPVAPTTPGVPPLARPPGPAELAAMRAESEPAEFLFVAADTLATFQPPSGPVGLVVVDRAHEVAKDDAARLRTLRADLGGPPLLLVTDRADPGERAVLFDRFGLRDPVHAGGGWDPGGVLDAVSVTSARARRTAGIRLVGEHRPAVVVAPSRERAERLAAGLHAAGLRAACWAPPPMRPTRAAAALAAWRARRLDALVMPAGALPPLGRRGPALLLGDEPASLDDWRNLVAAVGADRSVLVAGPGAPPEVAGYAAAGDDARARLLDHFGEPSPRTP